MLRKFAFLSGVEKKDRRALKRAWNVVPGPERYTKRQATLKTNIRLATALALKQEVERNRSVRRHTMADGTQVLWFASDQVVGEATLYARMKDGKDIVVARTAETVPDDGVLIDRPTFDKFWAFAVDDAIDPAHMAMLNS